MTIEQLDKARVLISLKNEDMDTYAISIDSLNVKDEHSRDIMRHLLSLACDKVGLSTQNKSVMIEALPHREGLLILITVDDKISSRKIYKIKKPRLLPCCKFPDAESLLSCVESLKAANITLYANSLWLYKNAYYLLFDLSYISQKARAILSEYALCMSASAPRRARIREAGKEVIKHNALETIAHAMCERM